MGKPSAPVPPDPIQTAGAQTGTNVSTAVANSFLNNVNQVTPGGSLTYEPTDTYSWTDPSTNQTYQIPRFTATQTLSPQQQEVQNLTGQAQTNLAGLAASQSAKIADILGSPLDISNAPAAGDASRLLNAPQALTSYEGGGPIQRSLGSAGNIATGYDPGWDITRSYGSGEDWSTDRQRVEESLMARLNPQLDRERANIEQRLADQGIRYGSPAYASAMDDYNRQANDARYGAISQAGQEQQRMSQQAQALAQFQNAAQQQGYGQNQGLAQFQNQAQQQLWDQILGQGSFANAAQAQQNQQNAMAATFANTGMAQNFGQQQSAFNAMQAARNQYMNEAYAYRNQPINEITALLAGSQVQQPNFINTPSSQIPTTDFAGIMNANANLQQQAYNTQSQSWNTLMGGILGIGAGAARSAMLSDRREKENIDRMGTVFAASSGGQKKKLPIYQYSYKDDPNSTRHVGPMAQDVERIEPRAVAERDDGVKFIDRDLVMGSILRAA